MGQKVNPHGLRVGVIKDWDSRWYADADFADYLVEDYNIRTFLKKKLYSAGVSKIEIERASDRVKIIIYTFIEVPATWIRFSFKRSSRHLLTVGIFSSGAMSLISKADNGLPSSQSTFIIS